MNPRVSVIVPVYQVEKYIRRCLDSILNQTYRAFEVIVVDDGSPDACPEICDEYQNRYPNVSVIHKENGGLSSARNAGMDVARGEYITFVDSDDQLHPYFIEKMLGLMNTYHAKIAQCAFKIVRGGVQRQSVTSVQENKSKETCYADSRMFGRRKIKITACGKIYHCSLLKNLRFPLGRINEDEFFTYKAIADSGKIAVTTAEYYFYYMNSDSIMHKERDYLPLDFMDAYAERISFFHNRGDTIAEELSRKEYAVRLMLLYSRCLKNRNNKNDKSYILSSYRETWRSVNRKSLVDVRERFLLDMFMRFPNQTSRVLGYMK